MRVVADILNSPGMNTMIEEFSRMPGKDSEATSNLTDLDQYNHNDNNWWCAWEQDRHTRELGNEIQSGFGSFGLEDPKAINDRALKMLAPAMRGSFLFRNIDGRELEKLSQVKCGPQLLSEKVIAWVRSTGPLGSRDGQAEALARAVLSTRWGCNRQGSHTAYSRQAYDLLHTLFPDSAAAKRTRYWFN
jgi:hypothetical protein